MKRITEGKDNINIDWKWWEDQIDTVKRYYQINIDGNAYGIPEKYQDRMINDVRVYLSDKEFLQKWSKELIGREFEKL